MSDERERLIHPAERPEIGERRPADAAPGIDRAARAARELSAGRAPSSAGFLALARAAGNRGASRLLQRQSATVTGRFLRVRVVGHASARWRSAGTAEQAAARNLALSEKRAAAVKEIILRELSGRVSVPIEVDVSIADDEDRDGVTVGSHGEGSRRALERTKGDRRSNEQRDRRVDIEAELVTSEQRSDRVRVRRSALTRDWLLTITRFKDLGLGYARAEVELEIKNPLSGKVAHGSARLEGLGRGGLLPDKGGAGPPDIRLRADRRIGFKDFDGCSIRMYQASIKLGYGWSRLYMVLGGIRKDPLLIERERGWGLPGGYGVMGTLHLDRVPDDFWETDEESAPYKRRHGLGESLSVMFDTGSAVLSTADADRIKEFSDTWARRFD